MRLSTFLIPPPPSYETLSRKAAQNKFHVLPPNFFENLGGRAKKQHKRVETKSKNKNMCVFFPEIQAKGTREVKHEIYFERPKWKM